MAKDLTPSILDLINAHREAVHIDEATFDENSVSLDPDASAASEKAECEAFSRYVSAPCLTGEDVRLKIDYIVNGTVGERDSLIDCLQFRENVEPFLRSLEVGGGKASS